VCQLFVGVCLIWSTLLMLTNNYAKVELPHIACLTWLTWWILAKVCANPEVPYGLPKMINLINFY
jgi:hypothetical protein